MRQKEKLIDPVDADADGLAQAQSTTGAASVTLNGALIVAGGYDSDYPRRLSVTSAGDDSGITFNFTGTDPDNKTLTESLTGTTGGAATTTAYFDTVSSVTTSGATAGNITVGTVDELVTNTIPLNTYNSEPATVSLEGVTGTIDVSVEQTFSRVQYSDIEYQDGPSALTNATTSAVDDLQRHASGVRGKVNSYTSGAQITMVVNQNDCGS